MTRRASRRFDSLARGLLLAGGFGALVATAAAEIRVEGDRVTIRAANQPVMELAAALANATGVAVTITGDPDTRLTIDVEDEPLERALSLVSDNHLLIRSSGEPGQVVEVVLILDSGDSGDVITENFLPSGEPAAGEDSDGYAIDSVDSMDYGADSTIDSDRFDYGNEGFDDAPPDFDPSGGGTDESWSDEPTLPDEPAAAIPPPPPPPAFDGSFDDTPVLDPPPGQPGAGSGGFTPPPSLAPSTPPSSPDGE